jgi:hypothetical protein
VSPLWKSELLVRIGRTECKLQVRSAWRREVLAEFVAPGKGVEAVSAAIAGLRSESGGSLPRNACLLVPDEHAYFCLMPATPAWNTARRAATDHFAGMLGHQDLVVQVAALQGGRWWLAAAIAATDLALWTESLAANGVSLARVELALLHDLRAIARHVDDRAVVALMREEGVTLLRVHEGTPVELSWERCDPHSHHCIEQRLLAFSKAGEVEKPDPLILLCRSAAQHDEWQRLAKAHRWTLLTPKAPAALMAARLATRLAARSPENTEA